MAIDISGTLVDAINCAPGDRGRMFFPESTTVLTRAELGPRANGVAAALLAAGAGPGEVVGVLLPAVPSFPPALLGVLTTGAAVSVLPLPAVAHDVDSMADDLAAFIRTVGIRHVVTGDLFAAALEPLQRRCPGLRVVNADRCPPATRVPTTHTPGPDDRAVVQFTSGTTARPQGVVLSHRAVLNGVLAPVARCELTPADVGYQWLPLFHDFGMIGLLISLCAGFDTHLVSPAAFIRRPVDALRYLGEHGVTICTGPNFAYDRLAEAARTAELDGLDLGRWRLALNGGEPVSPATVRAVTEVLGRHGLPASAMTPAYGMAEYCAGITIDLPALAPRTITLDRAAATDGRVVPVTGDSGWTIVSQGPPLPGTEVRVVDAGGTVLPEAGVGEAPGAWPQPHGRLPHRCPCSHLRGPGRRLAAHRRPGLPAGRGGARRGQAQEHDHRAWPQRPRRGGRARRPARAGRLPAPLRRGGRPGKRAGGRGRGNRRNRPGGGGRGRAASRR
ncbi:AMP-binding protein [Lentzea chajnantorensis]